VYYLKISIVDNEVAYGIINKLKKKFRENIPLTTTHEKVLEYLVMTIDYTTKGKVKISMYEYIGKILSELPMDMRGISKIPAAIHLYNVKPGAKKVQYFHHLVKKSLYLCWKTIQDMQTKSLFFLPGYKCLTSKTIRS